MPCLDCGKPTGGRARCATHERKANRRRTEKSKEHGLTTARWKRTRREVLKRARGLCELQLRGCTGTATTAHRLPERGTFHDSDLTAYVAACAQCHGRVDGGRAHR